MKSLLLILAILTTQVQISFKYTGEPDGFLWGNKQYIKYNAKKHEWINYNPGRENIFRVMDAHDGKRNFTKPEHVPEKKQWTVKVNLKKFNKPETWLLCGIIVPPTRRRFVLINPEAVINELETEKKEYRLWPHLGMLSLGTIAEQEGYDVVLHDELVQGYVNLEQLIQPGDIVGLSMVITGTHRGIELAYKAKKLGASLVLVGNDTAAFRAKQLLSLPGKPIDIVCTTKNVGAIRYLLQQVKTGKNIFPTIPGIATTITNATNRSNEKTFLLQEASLYKQESKEVFIIPKLTLFPQHYWNTIQENYQQLFGQKHPEQAIIKNSLISLAQGCTRTGAKDICLHCTIADVANIKVPSHHYLETLLKVYQEAGINYFYNITDSAFEMTGLTKKLNDIEANFQEGLMIYARTNGIANRPHLLEEWQKNAGKRLYLNIGFESGDDNILKGSVNKTNTTSPLQETLQAIEHIKKSSSHVHGSFIFGSPGDNPESFEKTFALLTTLQSQLGTQLDQIEADLFWLNFGSPAARIFHDYEFAKHLASRANKHLSKEDWWNHFAQYQNEFTVPWSCQEYWYTHFTNTTIEQAHEAIDAVAASMGTHQDSAPGRRNGFRPG